MRHLGFHAGAPRRLSWIGRGYRAVYRQQSQPQSHCVPGQVSPQPQQFPEHSGLEQLQAALFSTSIVVFMIKVLMVNDYDNKVMGRGRGKRYRILGGGYKIFRFEKIMPHPRVSGAPFLPL